VAGVYYLPRPVSATDLEVMRHLDRLHLEFPFAGSRMLRGLLAAEGCRVGRRHVKTLMKRMGIETLYRHPRTTKPEPTRASATPARPSEATSAFTTVHQNTHLAM
jgi:putative transposase